MRIIDIQNTILNYKDYPQYLRYIVTYIYISF